jgi:hypothetical protein
MLLLVVLVCFMYIVLMPGRVLQCSKCLSVESSY